MARSILALLAVTLLLGACSDSDNGTTTQGTVVFGEGEIPESFPDDFPIPDRSRVGGFLVDTINNRSEVVLRVQSTVPELAVFYEDSLPSAGFTVESSVETPTRWTITFREGELMGEISMTQPDSALANVVVEINRA